MTQAPPRPQFELVPPQNRQESVSDLDTVAYEQRPRIVVPVRPNPFNPREVAPPANINAQDTLADRASRPPVVRAINARGRAPVKAAAPRKARKALVAGILVLAFSGMLLATHRYVTSHWNPLVNLPGMANTFVVGSEGVTTTDLNLRPAPGTDQDPIGVAENGSRVRVLSVNNNWYEVQVLQHARPKVDPFTADRGWVNKKYLKFD
jgi:hypothetical protein